VPGPSAVTAAISVAGFSSKFFFFGFLSKKTKERTQELESLCKVNSSIVLYLPARDLKKSLEEFKIYFENRMIFIAREITKLHETYLSGIAKELLENIGANDLKGEITVVISDKSVDLENAEDVNLVYEINLLINKMSSKDMAEYLAKKLKISKKIIYQNILDLEK
jgi:16S rRNA (cytidine1402-2'-O)-methyltransferase